MTFSNYVNTPEDNEFLTYFPKANQVDDLADDSDKKRSCGDCEFYNSQTPIFPCATNPSNIYHANNCPDYSIGESNE